MKILIGLLLVGSVYAQSKVVVNPFPPGSGLELVPAGGGSGSGTVTSVAIAGTANQITATGTCTITTTGTCTLSLPSGLVLPGTINGLTITTTTGTITIASAKVLTVSNSLTLAGTDGVTLTFPTTSATIARTDAGQTFTGNQTMTALLQAGSTAPTQTQADNSTKVATTAYVDAGLAGAGTVSGLTANCIPKASGATAITGCSGATSDGLSISIPHLNADASPVSRAITGTTTANATCRIVGVGSLFVAQVKVGDRLEASGTPGVLGTVTVVTDDTHITLDCDWWGDSIGDGTTQTMTVFPSSFTSLTSSGATAFILGGDGQMAFGTNDYSNAGIPSVPNPEWWVHSDIRTGGNLDGGLLLEIGGNGTSFTTGMTIQASTLDSVSSHQETVSTENSSTYGNDGGTTKGNQVFGSLQHVSITSNNGASYAGALEGDVNFGGTGTTDLGEGLRIRTPQQFNAGRVSVLTGVDIETQAWNDGGTAISDATRFGIHSKGGHNLLETGSAGLTGLTIKGFSGQTADLQDWSSDSAVVADIDSTGIMKATGYKSSDGSAGVTVTTCTGFKNGLCVAGTP